MGAVKTGLCLVSFKNSLDYRSWLDHVLISYFVDIHVLCETIKASESEKRLPEIVILHESAPPLAPRGSYIRVPVQQGIPLC